MLQDVPGAQRGRSCSPCLYRRGLLITEGPRGEFCTKWRRAQSNPEIQWVSSNRENFLSRQIQSQQALSKEKVVRQVLWGSLLWHCPCVPLAGSLH